MKIINFINFAELNQLRLNMGANLVKKIGSNYVQKTLVTEKFDKLDTNKSLRKLALNKTSIMYSKDKSNPKIFHPIKN